MKVTLLFKGEVDVDIDADPEDPEAWAAALRTAIDRLSDSDLADGLECIGHEITG